MPGSFHEGPGEVRHYAGHTGAVYSVAVSPGGGRLLSGSADGTVAVWETETGRQLCQLAGHGDWVTSVAFLPGGRHAVSGSTDGSARIWDLEAGEEVQRFEHDGYITGVACSPDGRRVLAGSTTGEVIVWDLTERCEQHRLRGHGDWVTGVDWSPDGRFALSGGADLLVVLWDLRTGRRVRTLSGRPDTLEPAPAAGTTGMPGRPVPAARTGGTLAALELTRAGGAVPLRRHTCLLKTACFTPDGGTLLYCTEGPAFRAADAAGGAELRRFEGHTGCVRALACTPNGMQVISGSIAVFGGRDNTVRVWDLQSGAELHRFPEQDEWIWSVACTPDGRHAVSGGGDNILRLWRLPPPSGS